MQEIVNVAEVAIRGGIENEKLLIISVGRLQLERKIPFHHPIVNGPEEDLHEITLVKAIMAKFSLRRLSTEARKKTLLMQKNLPMRH